MDKENANPIVHGAVGSKRDASLFDAVPSTDVAAVPSTDVAAVPSTDVAAASAGASEAAAAGRGQIPPGWDPYEPLSGSDVGNDDEHHDIKTHQVLRRLQVGQYVSYLDVAKGVYRCPFCTRRLGVGALVNPNSFRAKHLALGMHLRSIQRVEISGGRMPPLKPKAPKGSNKWRQRQMGASNELWRIILEGYKPYNPDKLTRREEVDNQLNSIALHMIQTSVGTKDLALVRNFTTAKEAWEGLDTSFMGSESMKRNKYSALRNQAEGFMRLPDEDHQEMYRRLITIADAFRNVGAQHIDDFWIKDKYIDCMMPFEPIDVKSLLGRESYSSLTSQQVVHEMQGLKVAEQNSLDSRNRAIEMARETHGGRLIPKDKSKDSKAPNKKFYNKSKKNKRPSRIVLMTKEEYSSDDNDSSSDEEETSKEVAAIATTNIPSSSLFESPNENPHIKNAHFFMARSSLDTSIVLSTQEEYTSGDDDDDDDEGDETSNGLVALASLSNNSSSPIESPNEDVQSKEESCLMAKSSEVSSPNPSMPIISNALGVDHPSLKMKQEMLDFDEFILNLKGDTKKHVSALMVRIAQLDDTLDKKCQIEREDSLEIAALKNALEEG
ncbi:hypothetical protein QYE76_002273 [Lolium multiflorum]|uniref:Uncharacterized protein n=1 Tax=Lolium multiflorum TaxID=4521 RepID=A0AAD8RLB3_LOLMU|nr:hypothetical protein QYE76_002273 [Lolium multiflorum]